MTAQIIKAADATVEQLANNIIDWINMFVVGKDDVGNIGVCLYPDDNMWYGATLKGALIKLGENSPHGKLQPVVDDDDGVEIYIDYT